MDAAPPRQRSGTECTVAEIRDDGIMADVTFRPQTETDNGEHDQVVLADGQYEVIPPRG
jgi:hypothetical protein